jgi:hypothetical protein
MRVLISEEEVVVEPDHGDEGPSVRILRNLPDSILARRERVDPSLFAMDYAFLIVGVIRLLRGNYLVYVDEAELAAYILGKEILKVKSVKIVPFSSKKIEQDLPSSQAQLAETEMIDLLRNTLESLNFHFSFEIDLTNTFERQSVLQSREQKSDSFWEAFDSRFYWNKGIQSKFFNPELSHLVAPIVSSFVTVKKIDVQVSYLCSFFI